MELKNSPHVMPLSTPGLNNHSLLKLVLDSIFNKLLRYIQFLGYLLS